MKTSSKLAVVVACILMLYVSSAFAVSHFIFSQGPMQGLTISGTFRIYTIAGFNESTNYLVSKTATRDWSSAPGISGVAQLQVGTGLASVSSAWGSPRLYAVSQGVSGGASAALYQFTPNSSGGGTWFNITGNQNVPNLSNQPTIAAAWDNSGTQSVTVAIRDFQGTIWTCTLGSASGQCYWENESVRGTNRSANTMSPIAVNYSSITNNVEVYSIKTTGGVLQRYSWELDVWDDVGVPSSPPSSFVDLVSIHAYTSGGVTRVISAGWNGSSYGDTLQLAQSSGGIWSWTNLTPGAPSSTIPDVYWNLNNIALAPDPSGDRIWLIEATPNPSPSRALWYCDFNGSGCSAWTNAATPTDENPGWDGLGGAMWAQRSAAYITGSLGSPTEYLYALRVGSNGSQWENHLTLRDFYETLPGGLQPAELTTDEYYGTVVAAAFDNASQTPYAWRSTDDGNSWGTPFQLATSRGGDLSVKFDASGTPFISIYNVSEVEVTSWDSVNQVWRSPILVPSTEPTNDRPWMITDVSRPNTLYATFSGGNSANEGEFTYCRGTANSADCSTNPSLWCPASPVFCSPSSLRPYCLPSLHGCNGYDGIANCHLAQTSDGTMFVGVEEDTGCTNPPAGYPTGVDSAGYNWTSSIGIRTVTVSTGGCAPPTFGSPTCVYYVRRAMNPGPTGTTMGQINGGLNGPGSHHTFHGAFLSATRGAYSVLTLTVTGYRDISNDGPCLPTSRSCRSDVFFGYRDPSNGWCGRSCTGSPTMDTMTIVNVDQSYPLGWDDHVIPAMASLDNGTFAVTWLDFNTSNPMSTFFIEHAFLQATPHGGTVTTLYQTGWPLLAGNFNTQAFYGDVDEATSARLHAHFFDPFTIYSYGTVSQFTSVQSVQTGPF